ncbi:MAG TPA: Asp-tRNA(Asn)/Glu-tRNA(Gln) amidotransferase subunit GatC [Terriglobales bacterium]|nr:Asp-tRNA(Asn)/Glu-tRNA(Gln) amidotransferase subunit GatC [Terriglobales bacterium]
MSITEKDVVYVAGLANLALTEEERSRMVRDLNSILEYIDRLNQLDTTDVPPMAQVLSPITGDSANVATLREDIPGGLRESLPREAAVRMAPGSDGTFFIVPKVIER